MNRFSSPHPRSLSRILKMPVRLLDAVVKPLFVFGLCTAGMLFELLVELPFILGMWAAGFGERRERRRLLSSTRGPR